MNTKHLFWPGARAALLIAASMATVAPVLAQGQGNAGSPGTMVTAGDRIFWAVPFANAGSELRVSGPEGVYFTHHFEPGTKPSLNVIYDEYGPLPDGQYTYELRPFRTEPTGQRQNDYPGAEHFSARGSDTYSGAFSILDGRVVDNDVSEGQSGNVPEKVSADGALKDQVILDDLIVDGSACIGFDCVNGESFGFDTLRLKENNLRIKFQDTSTSASFPTNDWELTANDSSNGGANRFSIRDVDAGRDIFTVRAGAPSNSLYVSASGNVGFGTSTPVVENHIVDGDTPTVRLQQDGSSGFTPQTWDLAGNEANFFVRDVTNGSKLPFKIKPGAPTNSLFVSANGNVGISNDSPDSLLHVKRNNGTASMLIEDTGGTSPLQMMKLENAGFPRLTLSDSSTGESWDFRLSSGRFTITRTGTGGPEFEVLDNGDAELRGTLTEGSSRAIKEEIVEVDATTILSKLELLPINEWQYTGSDSDRHLGPMAEEFYETFGLGPDNKHIAPKDLAGVALVAAKALKAENRAKAERIRKLEKRVADLEELRARLEDLENRLGNPE